MGKNNKEKFYDFSRANKEKEMNKVLYNQVIEFGLKDELHKVEKMTTQALEAMLGKLELN